MAPKHQLVDSSSDSEPEPAFKVNAAFAEKYENKKRGEELSKLQDKYGKDFQLGDDDEDDETDYSTDDDDAELVTPEVDAAILRTLAKIRAKDPAVYEEGRAVFDEEEAETAAARRTAAAGTKTSRQKSSKPVLLKDFQRARLLANAQGGGDDDEDAAGTQGGVAADTEMTPVEEQRLLKQEMKAAFLGDDDDDSDDGEAGGLFKRREKGDDERAREERDYEKFLESAVGKKAVKAALGDEEAFLRDYILNRGWIDREDEAHHVPSYEEIVGGDDGDKHGPSKSSKKGKAKSKLLEDDEEEVRDDEGHVLNPGVHDSDDDELDEEAEDFEHRYNFRFEQAGAADLVTHSRDVGSASVRKPTTVMSARARAREAAKERKEAEKLQRKEELRRLKALKRKEVEERLQQVLEAAGKGTRHLEELDLDGEWDEKKHEEAMKKVYDEEYEGIEDEDFKPSWDDDIDVGDIVGDEDGSGDDEDTEAHLPFASTSALPAAAEDELVEDEEELTAPSSKKAKRDKKGKKGKRGGGEGAADDDGLPIALLETVKAQGDEEAARIADKLVDEYYALDYEDKIGDVKTRFHYAKVPAESFNLTPEEILLATDAELNSFMSLKKLAPYRQDSAAYRSKEAQKQRKKLKELREVIRNRKWGEEVDEAQAAEALEKRKEKKRRYKENAEKRKAGGEEQQHDGAAGPSSASAATGADGEPPKKKAKRAGKSERKRKQKEQAAAAESGGTATAA